MNGDFLCVSGGARAPLGPAPPTLGAVGLCDECSLLEEADHRIANHLALLAGYVRLKAADLATGPVELSRGSVSLLLASIDSQIAGVARLHRALAVNRRRESADLGGYLHAVCAPFVAGLSGMIEIVEDFPVGCLVQLDQVLPLTRIVTEAVTNAAKYSHAAGQAGTIRVCCRTDAVGTVLVEVSDDGPGLPETFDPETDGGLGFRLLRALGKQLKARIAFESTARGLRFQITLPPGT
jgi:two-component sensor histidine kinase